jgi:MFS family permease
MNLEDKIQQNKSSPVYLSTLVSLALGWSVIYADRLSISPLMNIIKSEFGLTYSEVGLIVSIYFIAYVAFTIPATLFAEKYGYKRVMIISLLFSAVSLGLAGIFGYTYSILTLFIAMHGMGAGAYYPTSFKIATDLSPKERRGFSSAITSSGMALGTILGLVISGPILAYLSNWQTMLLILAVPTAGAALLMITTVPSERFSKKNTVNFSTFGNLIRQKKFLLLCMAMFCSLYGYWVILTWGPTYLQETRGFSILASGLLTALFAAVAIPSSILIGKFSDKFGRKRIALLILPLAAISLLMIGLSPGFPILILSVISYGIVGKLTLDPVVVAWTGDIVKEESRGSAMALLNVFGMSSSILAPLITGVLADLTGSLSYGFYFGGCIVFLGFLFIALSHESKS